MLISYFQKQKPPCQWLRTRYLEAKSAEEVGNSQKNAAILKNITTFQVLQKGILQVKAGVALTRFVQKINDSFISLSIKRQC